MKIIKNMQENIFIDGDFVVIDLYHHYFSGVDILDDWHPLLVRLDEKGVKWLLYIPDSPIARELFSDYYLHQVTAPRNRKIISSLYVSNYIVNR